MGMIIGFRHYDNYVNKRVCEICKTKIRNIEEGDFDDEVGIWICSACKKLFLTLCDNCKTVILKNQRYYILNDEDFGLAKKIFCSKCITQIN